MDYSIRWQMENKSSHWSQSHEGEGGGGQKNGNDPTWIHPTASLGWDEAASHRIEHSQKKKKKFKKGNLRRKKKREQPTN